MCDMTDSYGYRCVPTAHGSNKDWFICVTWLIHMCTMTIHVCAMTHSYTWYDSFICVLWLVHMCDMTHSYVCHDLFIHVTWLIHMCDMTHSYLWYDSFIYVLRLIYMCDITHSYMCYDSFIHVTWLIHMCAMTHSYLCYDLFIRVPWLIHMRDMTHSYVCYDAFIHVTWLIHMCDMTHLYMWHDSFVYVPWLIHTCAMTDFFCDVTHSYGYRCVPTAHGANKDAFICVPWLIHTCDMTHFYVWHDSFLCVTWLMNMNAGAYRRHMVLTKAHSYMCHDSYVTWLISICDMTHSYEYRCVPTAHGTIEWRRLIASPKLQIILHKRAIKYRALLRKMTYKDKGSYESSPPCNKDLFICVPWLIYTCDMTHSYMRRDSFLCVTWLIHMDTGAYRRHMEVTKTGKESSLDLAMGWLRWVGSLKYRSLLQKSPIKETIFCKRDLWL